MAAFYFFVDPRLESATDPSNLNASDVMLLLVNNVVWWEPNHGVMECRVGGPQPSWVRLGARKAYRTCDARGSACPEGL